MTDDFWKSWWAVILIGGPIVIGWGFIAHSLYVGRHLPAMLKALENSSYINACRKMSQNFSLVAKIFLIVQISSVVIWPALGIRSGQVSAEDIRRFPPDLLRLLKINTALMFVGAVWGGVVYVMIKSR
jgi:hypothetical protein